jgi:phosphate transport system permease protein
MAVELTSVRPTPAADDTPRTVVSRGSRGDVFFRTVLRIAALSSFVITAMILIFLIFRGMWAFRADGLSFFTKQNWIFVGNQFGIGGVLPDTITIALMASMISIPVAFATAVFISEYAPVRLRRVLIAIIDLMAAIPSIVYALWGRFFLMPRAAGAMGWLSRHFHWFPPFQTTVVPSASTFIGSPVIAAMVVSLMAIPIITSLSREVFSQAPQGEREAAYALGSTRWGMVRTVVLPFGRGGAIGAAMLGIGRSLGETIAVFFIVNAIFTWNWHVLQSGGNSISAMIAGLWASSNYNQLSALMAAGLVLFAITLTFNALAAIVINRSRSGAATQD